MSTKDFEDLLTNELPKLNETLKAKGQPEIDAATGQGSGE